MEKKICFRYWVLIFLIKEIEFLLCFKNHGSGNYFLFDIRLTIKSNLESWIGKLKMKFRLVFLNGRKSHWTFWINLFVIKHKFSMLEIIKHNYQNCQLNCIIYRSQYCSYSKLRCSHMEHAIQAKYECPRWHLRCII
jgi:hypothetical protein